LCSELDSDGDDDDDDDVDNRCSDGHELSMPPVKTLVKMMMMMMMMMMMLMMLVTDAVMVTSCPCRR